MIINRQKKRQLISKITLTSLQKPCTLFGHIKLRQANDLKISLSKAARACQRYISRPNPKKQSHEILNLAAEPKRELKLFLFTFCFVRLQSRSNCKDAMI